MPRIADALARLMPRWSNPLGHTPPEHKASRTGALIAIETLGRPLWTPRDYQAFAREGFMQNAIVYRCVRMIAEAAASVPLLLYEGDQEHDTHPLLDLLARPNPDHTGHDFLESWFGFLLVSGNAYAEVVTAGGQLRELHVLRPDRMKVIPGPEGWPEGYEYTAGGQTVRFDGEAVPGVRPILHMRLFHPVNDYYGMSPIEAAATAIDIHNAASNWNKALLDNSARPSGALVYGNAESRMTAEQFERLKTELEQGFVGAKHAGRPLLLEGGLDWKPLSLSPKDMDFIEAKNSAAREIALALGVPPMLLGIPGDNTYSNYQEAQRAFWRQTVLPLVNRTARAFSNWLEPAFFSGSANAFAPRGQIAESRSLDALNLIPDLDSVEALSSEREALWARLERTTFLTANEKRAAVGYEPLEPTPETPPPDIAAKYSSTQPRVSSGNSDGGQWTDGGGGGTPSGGRSSSSSGGSRDRSQSTGGNTGDGRVLSDANPDDFTKPGTQLAQARGGRSRTGRPERPDLEAIVAAARGQYEQAMGRVQQRDPAWKPQPGVTSPEDLEGQARYWRDAAQEANARAAYLERGGVPFSFSSREDFNQFARDTNAMLQTAGHRDAEVYLRGSSLTGYSYREGLRYDSGPRLSDLDLAIVSPTLFRAARDMGVELRGPGAGTRTWELKPRQAEALGLRAIANEIKINRGRKSSFVIFESRSALEARGPYAQIREIKE